MGKSAFPWLKVNPNYPSINVAIQDKDPASVLNYYRKLLGWRKKTPAMHYGTYHDLQPLHPALWVYERSMENERYCILANFSDSEVGVEGLVYDQVVLGNYANYKPDILQPYEARICRI